MAALIILGILFVGLVLAGTMKLSSELSRFEESQEYKRMMDKDE